MERLFENLGSLTQSKLPGTVPLSPLEPPAARANVLTHIALWPTAIKLSPLWKSEVSKSAWIKSSVGLYKLKETKMKWWEEYCNKLFSIMDSFLVEISSNCVDICWLVKVRGHLDKVEKDQQRIKQKKLSTLSGNSSLKKRFLSDSVNLFLNFS